MKKHGKQIKPILLAVVLLIIILLLIMENHGVGVTEYELTFEDLPASFDGFRIAQISDLHNKRFGKDDSALIDPLKNASPDLIVFTGDLIDSRRTDIDKAMLLVDQAVRIAPCYYITGNHEHRLADTATPELEKRLTDAGVTVLNDQVVPIERNGETLSLIGINDPNFWGSYSEKYCRLINEFLDPIDLNPGFKILLCHRPELIDLYSGHDIDLVFTGHAHGGQFRIPYIGGVYAPRQGFFPTYDAGVFSTDGTTMIVSRGIGNTIIPFRINNPAEIVIAELHNEKG